jgi:hypothetical protein
VFIASEFKGQIVGFEILQQAMAAVSGVAVELYRWSCTVVVPGNEFLEVAYS